jgi:oxalate decarboxylase
VTDWMAHTPPEILAENFGVPADTFSKIPLHDLWIFQGSLPASMAADRASVTGPAGAPPQPFTFSLGSAPPVRQNKSGDLRIADSNTFNVSKTVAAALVTLRPGALREMHWHPNADEWQYWIKGKGRMGVFNTGPKIVTMDFNPGDIGYVNRGYGHYIKNTGDTDLQFLAVFKSSYYAEVSLSDWLTHAPPELVAQHLNVDEATIAKFVNDQPGIVPA